MVNLGFSIYQKLDLNKVKIDIEESINKLRWNVLCGKVRNDDDDNVNEDNDPGEFVDIEESKININRLKSTQLPYNTNVRMPQQLKNDEEVRLVKFKDDVMKEVRGLEKESKKWKEKNVSKCEWKGIKKLKERINDGEIVCYETDKSGRWSVDTVDNYKKACEEHLNDENKTREITLNEHKIAEKEMNAEGMALLNMMGLDEMKGGDMRVRNVIKAENTSIPPFYGMRKDHKKVEENMRETGPKVRPVCGAKDCVTKRVSHLLCQIIYPLVGNESTHCWSTDDLINEIEKLNEEIVDEEWIVASLDVDALYPSLDIEKCTKSIVRKMNESEIVFEGLQWKEIALYLRYHMNDEEIEQTEYKKFCPVRRTKKGPNPKFTCSGTSNKEENRMNAWIFEKEEPDDTIVRGMFCDAIGIMIKKTMEMHDYKFDSKVYRQLKGGAIGMDLTGVIADIYMCEWDKMLMEKIKNEGYECKMYKRYKDDVNMVLRKKEKTNQNNIEVMNEIKELADSIDKSLTVKTDISDKYQDRKLPILDLKVWIGNDKEGRKKVLYTHYMKDVSTKKVIKRNSAHGEGMKQNVLVNDICRVMRNCSERLDWNDDKKENLEMYMRRMQVSGYSEEDRLKTLKKANTKYEKLKNKKREYKYRKNKSKSWYLKDGKNETVMFVNATPNEILKKKIEQSAKKHKIKVKVVERRGKTMKQMLQKSDPFKKLKCNEDDCVICREGMEVDCRMRGIVYEIECKEEGCMKKYIGQTGRSLYERMKEHNMYTEKDRENDNKPIAKHSFEEHQGKKIKIGVKVVGNMYGKPTKRMIAEAVNIDELLESESMNEKRGWSFVKI